MGNRRILGFAFLMLTVVLAVSLRLFGSRLYGSNTIFAVVNSATSLYQIKRVAAGIVIFLYGYVFLCFALPKLDFCWIIGLAAPVALALWSCLSVLVLMFRIPYNRMVMLAVMLFLILVMYFTAHDKKRYFCHKDELYIFCIIFGAIILFSTGLFPIIMTGDSYNYVMKYGMVIANENALNFSSVGALMSWTGIASALFSSLSAFWGTENIHIFHYELVASMLWVMYLYYESERKKIGLNSRVWSVVYVVFLMVCPPFVYLSAYLISNTYFMVYIVLTSILIANLHEMDDKDGLVHIISLLLTWLCLSRIEAFPLICFLLLCYSYRDIPRNHFEILALPMLIVEIGFVIYVKIQRSLYSGTAVKDQYTMLVLAVYAICVMGILVYLWLYDVKGMVCLRKRFPSFVLACLLLILVILGFANYARFAIDLSVTAQNLMGEVWGYTPLIFTIIYIGIVAAKRGTGYWDMILWGYILFNFCLCLGRINDLRLGVGDSYNRMLLSIVPIAVIVVNNHIFDKPQSNCSMCSGGKTE